NKVLKHTHTHTHRKGQSEQQEGEGWAPSSAITGRRLLNASEWCSLLLGRQIKILHSLKFDPGAKPSNHGLQINSCSVHLEDIKKEKPFFNSEVQLQARARTDQVSDIIVISSEDSAESSDGDEFPEPSTPTPRRAAGDLPDQGIEPECPPWQADTLPLSHLGSQNTPIKIEPRNFRKTTTSRKRVWQRVIRSEESLESSEDEAPWGTQSSALRSDPDKDPTDIRNTSIRRRSNRKRWMSDGDSSDLSNEGEPQATSRSALRNGSGKED
uniref:Uncharacterized protein n=1 Tax=Bos indicus x Bos taurus TaxID=30522 RepID=A0A4W2HZ26_BOBOX